MNLGKIINRLIIVVSVGVIAHLVFLLFTNEENIFDYLSQIDAIYFLLILVCLSGNWLGHGLRILIWTRYVGQPLTYRQGVKTAVYTELGAAITPTLIGGGPIKLALLIRYGLSAGKAAFITLLGGFEDFLMYTAVFVISFFYARNAVFKILGSISAFVSSHWLQIMLAIIIIYILRLIFKGLGMNFIPSRYSEAWNNLVADMKAEWHEMLASFRQVSRDGLPYFIMSFTVLIFQWMSRFTVLVLLLMALGIAFKPYQIYLQQWIVYLTMIFIPTPGATGGAEATFFLLFDGEIPKNLLPLIVSTWRFFIYYLMLFTAVVLVQIFRFYDSRPQKANE